MRTPEGGKASHYRTLLGTLTVALTIILPGPGAAGEEATGLIEAPYVPFVATPEGVVDEMLEIAHVGPADVLYDLGSGDGRIVIAAAKRYGARGVGIEIDPELIRTARENASQAGVEDRVRFVQEDFFAADLREATVVTLYLLPEVNRRLLPKLLAELRPGTRILSYRYDLGDWAPEKTIRVSRGTVYYWVVPPATR